MTADDPWAFKSSSPFSVRSRSLIASGLWALAPSPRFTHLTPASCPIPLLVSRVAALRPSPSGCLLSLSSFPPASHSSRLSLPTFLFSPHPPTQPTQLSRSSSFPSDPRSRGNTYSSLGSGSRQARGAADLVRAGALRGWCAGRPGSSAGARGWGSAPGLAVGQPLAGSVRAWGPSAEAEVKGAAAPCFFTQSISGTWRFMSSWSSWQPWGCGMSSSASRRISAV